MAGLVAAARDDLRLMYLYIHHIYIQIYIHKIHTCTHPSTQCLVEGRGLERDKRMRRDRREKNGLRGRWNRKCDYGRNRLKRATAESGIVHYCEE